MTPTGAAWLLCIAVCSRSLAAEPIAYPQTPYAPLIEPINWQGSAGDVRDASSEGRPSPALDAPVNSTATPLLDNSAQDELLPPFDDDASYPTAGDNLPNGAVQTQRGVHPYSGGHPGDWPWGCGGSPFRTGPGWCDTWRVGPVWDVAIDGIVMSREDTDLAALEAQLQANDPEGTIAGDPPVPLIPTFEQFDHGPGGRITFTSQVACHIGWDVQCAYEGIPEWHASIVYPKLPLDPPPLPPPGSPVPPDPIDLATEQRSLHYTSSLHSAELNFVQGRNLIWRPYFGVRYIKFDDEINDFYNQEAPPPLAEQLGPGAMLDPPDPPALPTVTTTDRLNLFDLQNDLIGFQMGLLHDTWRVHRRFAIEGFVNGGVYYNKIKYTNLMGTFTTQVVADNIDTTDFDESRIDFSDTVNNDVREYSEISYVTEASLSGVCRLNKCWALRGGYQVLWITNLHLADAAYLGSGNDDDNLLFHGWHAGVECRR